MHKHEVDRSVYMMWLVEFISSKLSAIVVYCLYTIKFGDLNCHKYNYYTNYCHFTSCQLVNEYYSSERLAISDISTQKVSN